MKLNFVDEGEGYPLLLIHGFCNDLTLWDEVRIELAKHYRVLAIDLPGHGNSPFPGPPITFPKVADAVATWLESKGVQECVVIGHSMGGYVTLTLAENYPDLVKAFGLFHSNAFVDTPDRFIGRNRSIQIVRRQGMGTFIESFIPFLFYHERIDELMPMIDKATLMAMRTSADTHIAFTKAMRDRADRSHLLSNDTPKLLIIGDHDSAVPADVNEAMKKKATHATIHTMKDTGHMGMLERPLESIETLHRFLQSVV